jgi:hypothetical protein
MTEVVRALLRLSPGQQTLRHSLSRRDEQPWSPRPRAQNEAHPGFTTRYDVDRLVWYEPHDRIDEAIAREKAMKKWRRAWKVEQIEAMNPEWHDLYPTLNM